VRWILQFGIFCLLAASVSIVEAQTAAAEGSPTAPPKLALLVYQKFPFDKGSDRDKWEIAIARACEKLEVPNSWIDLEPITGDPEVLWFDPFDSFAHVEKAFVEWGPIYATHPELGRLQAQIKAALVSERTVIAVRRDDLSYRANRIDLSKARFVRVLEVRLHPGHENDFAEAFQKLRAAYETTESDLPWVVYQVNLGMPSPMFLAFVPMEALRQNDDLLARRKSLQEAEGEETAERMQQIAREAYAATESNLYSINPEKSHVSKEFAAGDPDFWTPKKRVNATSEASAPTKKRPAPKSGTTKPKP
jgi:hypothetical protein